MVSKSCVIEKTGKKFHNTAFVCFSSPRKYESILRGFYNAVSVPGDCHVALLLAMTLSTSCGIKYTPYKVRILMLLSPTSTQYLVGTPCFSRRVSKYQLP